MYGVTLNLRLLVLITLLTLRVIAVHVYTELHKRVVLSSSLTAILNIVTREIELDQI